MKVEFFCNHFSLAMFSSQKETRYENQENRQKNQQNNQENQTKIFFSVFCFFLLFKPFYYLLLFFPSILYLTRT